MESIWKMFNRGDNAVDQERKREEAARKKAEEDRENAAKKLEQDRRENEEFNRREWERRKREKGVSAVLGARG